MKFPYLDIANFMGIGKATVDLADKGLVLIQGVNDDDTSANSNGAGKSSFADALAWCFYGATRKGLAADEVVNTKAGKNTHVIAHAVEDDGSFYIVERWRKKSVGGKRAGCSLSYTDTAGNVTDLTKGTDKLTQVEIDKALGCPEDVFLAAVYSAQEAMPDLPAMTDTELKKLIEEASGITVLVRAYEIARQKLKDTEREHDTWRLDHVRLENDVNAIASRLTDLKQRESGYEEKRKTEIASHRSDLHQAHQRALKSKQRRDEVNVEHVNTAITKLDEKISAVHDEQDEEAALSLVWNEANSKLMTGNALYRQLVSGAQALRAELDKINERVGEPCGTCGKTYCEEDIDAAKTLATEKLRIEVTKAREQKADIEALQASAETAQSALESFKSTRTDIRSTVDERRRLALLLVQRQDAEKDLARDVEDARRHKASIDAKSVETNPFSPLIDKAKEEQDDILKAHRASEESGAAIQKKIQVSKEVVRVFGPAGVRAHVLDTVTPYLNQRTSEYLGVMSDGNITAMWSTITLNGAGVPTEKFAITVEKPGFATSFAGLSGGEKRKVRLSCALALQDLVASRATKPIELWIGDEIDDAMDEAGLERLMGVLEAKARERGTVAVISHNALGNWIRDVATVTMKDQQSTITGVLEVAPATVAKAA